MLKFDVWSVNCSEACRPFVQKTYPWIILNFVPGGCTGIWQPCDAAIQRLLNPAIKHAQLEDVITEVSAQLDSDDDPGLYNYFKLDTDPHSP
jgi:hypothetical protein